MNEFNDDKLFKIISKPIFQSFKYLEKILSFHALFIDEYIIENLKYEFKKNFDIRLDFEKYKNKESIIGTINPNSKKFNKALNYFNQKYGQFIKFKNFEEEEEKPIEIIVHECPICFEENNLETLGCCSQLIHSNCLNDFLNIQKSQIKTCPLCRQQPFIK